MAEPGTRDNAEPGTWNPQWRNLEPAMTEGNPQWRNREPAMASGNPLVLLLRPDRFSEQGNRGVSEGRAQVGGIGCDNWSLAPEV